MLIRTDGFLQCFLKDRRFHVPAVRVLQNIHKVTLSQCCLVMQCGNFNSAVIWCLNAPSGVLTDLLHEHVDVGLGCVQDVSVWVFQAFHCDFHRISINVDPPGGATCQERPGPRRVEITKDHKALFCQLINSLITEAAVYRDQHSSEKSDLFSTGSKSRHYL